MLSVFVQNMMIMHYQPLYKTSFMMEMVCSYSLKHIFNLVNVLLLEVYKNAKYKTSFDCKNKKKIIALFSRLRW